MQYPTLCNVVKASVRNKLLSCNFLTCQCFHKTETKTFSSYSEMKKMLSLSAVCKNQRRLVETDSSKYSFNDRKSDSFKKGETLVQLDDPDTFGLIGRSSAIFTEPLKEDDGDKKEEEYTGQLPLRKDKLPMQKYIDMIKVHVANKRIKEAIDILEVRMLQEDRVKPDSFIYNLLIGSCSQVGFTDKAFKLFNNMKKRGLKVSGGIYTSLFNACANSPWKEDGIRRATKLRELMIEKNVSPNTTTYNCMIKAYGRCGDIQKAFEIVDEMLKLGIPLRTHTFNFLLQACISDKKSGFRTALITWRKMLAVREKPNIYSFNLMLRCIIECGFGDNTNNEKIINDLLKIEPPRRSRLMINEKPPEIMNISLNTSDTNTSESHVADLQQNQIGIVPNEVPNFLARFPEMKDTVGFGEVKTAADRFMMVGGSDGLFREMNVYHVSPDIRFVTQLLELIPSTLDDENKLLSVIKTMKIKTDIDFYNMLMKKRCFRKDYNAAKDVLDLIKKENKLRRRNQFTKRRKLINVDIVTYGVLAMCNETKDSALEYIQQLNEKRIRINSQILGSLLKQAICHNDFEYIKYVIEIVQEQNIQVNDVFMDHLRKHLHVCNSILSQKNSTDKFTDCKKFVEHYDKWMKILNKKKQEEPEHPWLQFREKQPETFQRFRDHVEFKKRIYKSRIRSRRYEVKC